MSIVAFWYNCFAILPDISSISIPLIFFILSISGFLPKKLPIAQLGSNTFPFSNPNLFNALYIPSITSLGV